MEAAGLGNMAAGVGSYNLQTSEAYANNVNTNMQLSTFMYQSLGANDKKLWAQKSKELNDYNLAVTQTEDRLRNHPTEGDIVSGDALNIALTELSDPKYAAYVAQAAAGIKISGKLIQQIPFNSPTAAMTGTIDMLTDAEPPALLKTPEFQSDLEAYRKLADELNEEAAKTGDVKPATVKKFRAVIQGVADKLAATDGIDQNKKNEVEMHLKAFLGLSYVLDGPSLDVFLAGAGDMKEVGLDRLIAFMRSFHVRFGPATNPNQIQTYETLYPMLVALRDQMFGKGTGTLPSHIPDPNPNDKSAMKFYGGMHMTDLHPDKDRTPPAPPAPQPGQP
jgi:hypothetical protein